MGDTPVAVVTGASRGIGKASALALAEAGFDVAITARTVHEGDGRSEPNSVRGDEPVVAVPGSLESTAAEIERRGRRALSIPMDLLDLAAVEAVPGAVLDAWGRIDVLFNNAIYQGAGTMDRILDMRQGDLDNLMRGNFSHQIRLIQLVVPHMLERGEGRVDQHGVGLGPPRSARPGGRRWLGGRLLGVEGGLRAGGRRDRGRVP